MTSGRCGSPSWKPSRSSSYPLVSLVSIMRPTLGALPDASCPQALAFLGVMSTRKEMPGRLLRLLSLLQNRREWSGRELAERLGVTERTVRRDVDRLRSLDYPV